jgi:hypothetical protein
VKSLTAPPNGLIGSLILQEVYSTNNISIAVCYDPQQTRRSKDSFLSEDEFHCGQHSWLDLWIGLAWKPQ